MEKVQSADGTTIAYERSGSGPALVVALGAFNDRTNAKPLAGVLGSQFTVYAYDRRGCGDSDTGGAEYAIEREVEDLAAVLDAVALHAMGELALVYGHSSGASIAVEAAARDVPMRALAVYEPPYAAGATLQIAGELAALAAAGQASETAERFLLLTGVPAQAVEGMKQAPYWPRMSAFAGTLPHDATLASGPIPAGLAGVSFPVLALAGGDSPDWATANAAAIGSAMPGGSSHVLPGQTHAIPAEVLAPVLSEFFLAVPD